ncbi:HORMA domain-containing protein 2 isoform X2 [Myotis myotis]|uniref:HORMA domain containing 2 n=1 Tax=Myotis myotis TaxID=51298 RepID=A0A7J7S1Z4_MYOMY|nr:HORMA domain-containing protein 2 isoform X2 [Myotis myotis]KAF6282294.1 HORMA domain containing 2 [Myotis myotis]
MAIAQLSHSTKIHKASKRPVFPFQICDQEESLTMVKKLFATSVSCITYLRGLFPESSYGNRHLEDLNLKILREDENSPGSVHIVKWIQGCFDALERGYLYPNPKEPEKVTEIYQFKFKYTDEGITMDFDSSNTSTESGTKRGHMKKASILLLRKLYILMQNLGPLPNDVVLTMKLHYYNAVTPDYYQPPGFKHGVNSHILLFEGEPVNLQVGVVSTGFHSMKLKVITEATRVSDLEDNLFQENSVTEMAHQGLDGDEEEEGSNNQVQRTNIVFGQQSSESARKKRKVSEPLERITPESK